MNIAEEINAKITRELPALSNDDKIELMHSCAMSVALLATNICYGDQQATTRTLATMWSLITDEAARLMPIFRSPRPEQ